MINWLLSVFT